MNININFVGLKVFKGKCLTFMFDTFSKYNERAKKGLNKMRLPGKSKGEKSRMKKV